MFFQLQAHKWLKTAKTYLNNEYKLPNCTLRVVRAQLELARLEDRELKIKIKEQEYTDEDGLLRLLMVNVQAVIPMGNLEMTRDD